MDNDKIIKALRQLKAWEELEVAGEMWLRLEDDEFKVSPHHLVGNYDLDCYWVAKEELADYFPS